MHPVPLRLLLPLCALLGAPAGAQPPRATLADFAWLTGTWQGTPKTGPGTLEVTYSTPRAGLMTGMIRLVDGDRILVVELIALVETPTGVEMRFRHFSETLVAYETDFKQTMRLVVHAADHDTFENTVAYTKGLLSTQPRLTTLTRTGADAFVGRSDIIGSDEKPTVIEAAYRRVR
jgi:hypothetical protein